MFPSIESEPIFLAQTNQANEFKDYASDEGDENNQSHQEHLVMETGYDTFLREEKEEILLFFKRQLLILRGFDADALDSETSERSPDWTKLLKGIGAKSFNQLLKEIIPQYRPKLTLTTKELTNLRKKIKGWFKSEGIVEKRGDPLIHDDEIPRFKEMLIQVMKVRNFEQLRKDILPYVKEIRMKSSKKFDDSMFSNKFWYTFLSKEENKNIKVIWENLPLPKDSHTQKPDSNFINRSFLSSLDFLDKKEKPRMKEPPKHIIKLEEGIFCNEDENNDHIMEEQARAFIANFEETKTSSFNAGNLLLDKNSSLQTSQEMAVQLRNPDTVQIDFIESFWSTWNERSLVENTDSNTTVFIRQEKEK